MRIGVILPAFADPGVGVAFNVELARRVEALGFDGFYCGDHMFGHAGNPEPLTVLAAAAAVTERLTLGTNVLLLGLREPAVAAKQLATIDQLAEGRLVCGVGVGGEMPREWEAMEVDRSTRGRRLDEYLVLLRELWSGEPVDHRGEFRTIRGVTGSPAPARRGGPPIWIGGRSPAALRRAARFDGWTAYATSVATLAARVEELRAERPTGFAVAATVFAHVGATRAAALRDANAIVAAMYRQDLSHMLEHIGIVGTADDVARRLAEYRSAGPDELIICPLAEAQDMHQQLERLAELALASPTRGATDIGATA